MPGFKRSKKNPKLNLNPKCQLVRSSVKQFVEEHDFWMWHPRYVKCHLESWHS